MYSLAFYKKEFATNWKLAFPVILGMLGHTFVAFADNIMVGQLGAAELPDVIQELVGVEGAPFALALHARRSKPYRRSN